MVLHVFDMILNVFSMFLMLFLHLFYGVFSLFKPDALPGRLDIEFSQRI